MTKAYTLFIKNVMTVEKDAILAEWGAHACDELANMNADKLYVDQQPEASPCSHQNAAEDESLPHSDFHDDVVARNTQHESSNQKDAVGQVSYVDIVVKLDDQASTWRAITTMLVEAIACVVINRV